MTKIGVILCVFLAFSVLACQGDDTLDDLNSGVIENPTQGGEDGTPQDKPTPEKSLPEKLIGDWLLRDRTDIGITYCELQTRYTFKPNHTFELDFYSGDEPGNCDGILTYGSWTF